jgi:hypothetical protein
VAAAVVAVAAASPGALYLYILAPHILVCKAVTEMDAGTAVVRSVLVNFDALKMLKPQPEL